MTSEETALALSHRLDTNRHQILFQNDPVSAFRSNLSNQRPGSVPDRDRPAAGVTNNNNNGKATRELTGFIDHQHRYYQPGGASDFRQGVFNSGLINHRGVQNWNSGNGRGSDSPSGDGDGSDGDEDEDDDDDDDVEGLVNGSDNNDNKNNNNSGHCSEKEGNVKLNNLSSFGSNRKVLKVGSVVLSGNDLNDAKPSSSENHQPGSSQYPNAVALVDRDGELYYSQYLHGTEGLGSGLKDTVVENGCGFSGRKDTSYSSESGDSLRSILSDPLTGALMDDAVILPCGHSFGSGGIQHVMKMKACCTCSHLVTESSVAPNLSLRSAVLAFRKEEESQGHHASKRRRERLDQDRISYHDLMDTPRGKGLQFPFSIADRVIIKGNKRTPERFFGCEAIVTTQCLNGWYVVKTLDTAESIKLQYRSLARVSDNSSSHPTSTKMAAPNWL